MLTLQKVKLVKKRKAHFLLSPLEKRKAAEEPASSTAKKLQKHDSDVSTDSKGFPNMFASSSEGSPCMDSLKKESGGLGPSKPEGSTLSRGDTQRRDVASPNFSSEFGIIQRRL